MVQSIDTLKCSHAPVKYKEDFSRSTEKEKMHLNFLILYASTLTSTPPPQKKKKEKRMAT